MRLHSLAITAFGPFAGTERVDFDALSRAGLFLFTGATGAGKTSVLDAVCFALYGQVPGARQGARSLRSDHAAPGVAPQVDLEVTVRGRRLRVTRSPAWDRPKLRGTGTRTEQARVLVQEWAGGQWSTLSTRLDEAGQLLGSLLGLSLAQFCQVVLLPQGQFAEFLRADADRRRALLESLFDTGRFAEVEGWLVARRQETGRRLADVDDELRQLLARVAEAAGGAVPDEPSAGDDTVIGRAAPEAVPADAAPEAVPADAAPEAVPADAAVDWVEGLLAATRAAADTAAAERTTATVAAAAAATALAEGRRREDIRRRAEALTSRLAELETAAEQHDTVVTELENARRVAPLGPIVAQASRHGPASRGPRRSSLPGAVRCCLSSQRPAPTARTPAGQPRASDRCPRPT